jgi:hypothetical protein
MQNGAIKNIVHYFKDNEAAIQEQANARTAWVASGKGASNDDQFQQKWRQAFDRSNPVDMAVLSTAQRGPQAFSRGLAAMPQQYRQYAVQKARQLLAIGAIQ